jgi:hypothetical protein
MFIIVIKGKNKRGELRQTRMKDFWKNLLTREIARVSISSNEEDLPPQALQFPLCLRLAGNGSHECGRK